MRGADELGWDEERLWRRLWRYRPGDVRRHFAEEVERTRQRGAAR